MEKIMKCQMCGKEHPVEILTEKTSAYIKDELVEYEETVYYCSNCDEDEAYFAPMKIENENLNRARNAYRIMKGLLTSDEIVNLRKKYGLSQVELSKIMDFGEATISRYEAKSIQDEAHDNMLRIVIENPIELLKLLEKNKLEFDNHEYNLIRSRIVDAIQSDDNKLIKRQNLSRYYAVYSEPSIENGYTILKIDKLEQVINYFALKLTEVNKVMLMKLLWYSDVLAYKKYGKAITGLVYEHKPMGALPKGHNAILELSGIKVEETYNSDFAYPTYTVYSKNDDFSMLTENETDVLNMVYEKFKGYNGKKIKEYMHSETAYINTSDKEIITFSYAKEVRDF